ncbi:MAG: patatin family protein [Oscillospiraceae bacterium]|nr:patatin family protein [Oscillospiraceae bacterium]
MKTGLILEGGAMRGIFTCGVLDVFMEHGIVFDGGAGISAGAVFGCNFKSRQIGRTIRYNKKYCRDPRYCSVRSLLKTGDLYGVAFCYHELIDVLDPFDRDAFSRNPMAFYVGATDIERGEIVYHRCRDGGDTDIEWIRASASMPLVSRVVEVDGHRLWDGGIADPVPYRFMEGLGYDRNVLVLTQPEGYRKKRPPGVGLLRLPLHRYPRLMDAIATRHARYNQQMEEIDQSARSGECLVIRPPAALGIRRTERDPAELERVYQCGRRTAEAQLSQVRDFLSPEGAAR